MKDEKTESANSTPKFKNSLSFDISQINNNNSSSFLNVSNPIMSDIDLASIKSSAPINNNQKGEKKGGINIYYKIFLKGDCDVIVEVPDTENILGLQIYRRTFDDYLAQQEGIMKTKYGIESSRLATIQSKLHWLRVKMIVKLINEIYSKPEDIFFNNSFGKDFDNTPVKKRICLVLKLNIPNDEQEYFHRLAKNKKRKSQDEFEENLGNAKENVQLIGMDLLGGIAFTLKKIASEHKVKSLTSDEYKELLGNIFIDVSNANPQMYDIFNDVLAKIEINGFFSFIKVFCIFLHYSEDLLTKFKIIGHQLHIEIFGNDEILLKKCEENGYYLKLSKYGVQKILNFNRKTRRESKEQQIITQEMMRRHTRYIYLPYVSAPVNVYELYDIVHEKKVLSRTPNADSKVNSNLRDVDRIRLILLGFDNSVNCKNFQSSDIFDQISIKRDKLTAIEENSSQLRRTYFYPFLNIFSEAQNLQGIRNFQHTFGEATSFYLLWTYHFFIWLLYFSVIALAFYIVNVTNAIGKMSPQLKPGDVKRINDFSVTIAFIFWMKLYLCSWKAEENTYSIKWGTAEIAQKLEKDREEFEYDSTFQLFSNKIPEENLLKKICAYGTSFVITAIMLTLTVISLIAMQEIQLPHSLKVNQFDILFSSIKHHAPKEDTFYTMLPYAIGIFNVLFNKLYKYLCKKLTDGENHQKESQYRKAFLLKLVLFSIVNHYFTFYYIIFYKSFQGKCPSIGCTPYLAKQLHGIVTSHFAAALFELLTPFVKNMLIKLRTSRLISEAYPNLPPEELKIIKRKMMKKYSYLILPKYTYDDLMGEYQDIIILFGFVCQFGLVKPLLFLLFTLYVFVQRIIDPIKIVKFYNVSMFEFCQGIGIFNKILKFFLLLATFLNIYICFFILGENNNNNKNDHKLDDYFLFILAENIFLIITFFLDFHLTPNWVDTYPKVRNDFDTNRRQYIKNKILLSQTSPSLTANVAQTPRKANVGDKIIDMNSSSNINPNANTNPVMIKKTESKPVIELNENQ